MRRISSWSVIPPLLAILAILVIWQLAVSLFDIRDWVLPSPMQIIQEGMDIYPRLLGHSLATIQIALGGFALGVGVGLLLAILLHLMPRAKESIYPLMVLSQNVPIIALAPLLVLWFGFGTLPKILIITLVCFFPVAVSLIDGFRQTNPTLLNYMQMIGASRRQIFFKLEWPSALPYFFSGLKISATYSVMGAVIAEWLGAQEGLGVFMTVASSAFRTDQVFVAIFVIMAISLLLFGFIMVMEKWLVPWDTDRKGADDDDE
ncbi:ABC transporter permease [Salinicoccus roseus]|uniref:ABC transporter permease n=1 Tax=Salinicoccus roseus TaxID=45670 RepID=UPI000F4E3D3D|nr:ABC transporter permease [Salinicoccus roseus]RPE54826.1 ABC-type nitrate/sulfonate/bicarbonate transport system permease component [Salinicoccus roseus]GGA62289.1 ABC transporter permease [Salinicoccus roseus]